jgi:hypothetical protein
MNRIDMIEKSKTKKKKKKKNHYSNPFQSWCHNHLLIK